MQNCEKSILVAYININNINRSKGIEMIHQMKCYLEDAFINRKEIDDDSVIILVIPSDKTEIQLLNAKYPDYKTIVETSEKIIKDYLDKCK